MRKLHFFALFFSVSFFVNTTQAQRVGIGTNSPSSSAMLEVKSADKGFLPPRMSLSARNAIRNPEPGLIIYCTDCGSNGTGEMNYFNGSVWASMNMDGSSDNTTSLPKAPIGSQVWSSKNSDVVTYRNGDPIPEIKDSIAWRNATAGAWCWYNNDSAQYAAKYGRLYNWYAITDPRNIAPVGWHVPTLKELKRMIQYLDADADTTNNFGAYSTFAGKDLKNTTGWDPQSGNNSSGFSAVPGGYRNANGRLFDLAGSFGTYWLSNINDTTQPNFFYLKSSNDEVIVDRYPTRGGFSLRLLRDQPVTSAQLPLISTASITSITTSSANSGGQIIDNGGSLILAKGLCWSETIRPTITAPNISNNGIGNSDFLVTMNALNSCAKYYVRAYATNAMGTSYGQQQELITPGVDNASVYTNPNLNLDALLGNYTNTNEDFGGPYGPYRTTVISTTRTSSTTGDITIDNIYDYGWAPITFHLNWADPLNRKVTLDRQENIAPASTVNPSPTYSGWQVWVEQSSAGPGTFSLCDQKITLKMTVGLKSPDGSQSITLPTPYQVVMER